ncbi:MAG: AraC-like DNA-binding protein [Halieaceae bacterium]|jgi:AraC-like DNA-binding protein
MSLPPTVPIRYVAILADLVRQRGGDNNRLLGNTGIQQADLARFDRRIQFREFSNLVGNAYLLTGDVALGLHFGGQLNLSSHATLGHALMNCADFLGALQLFLKYYPILASNLELSYHEEGERCYLTPRWEILEFNEQFSYEFLFASILTSARFLLNRTEPMFRLELPYAEPHYVNVYRELFGDDVHFDCPVGRLSLHRSLLTVQLPSSNQVLRDLYEQECKRLLADLVGHETVAEQTLQVLRQLEGQYPQGEAVAALLNYSPRTYRRRLEDEDVHYQQLLDQVRTEHAMHHLIHTRLPTTSIAYMLGFNDASNFRRAFIKWTGMSPREARKNG